MARFAGDAEKQISRRSPEPPAVRADHAFCILAAVPELPVQPRLQGLALSSRDTLMPALRKMAQWQGWQ